MSGSQGGGGETLDQVEREGLWEGYLGESLKEVRGLSTYQGEDFSWPAEEQVQRPREGRPDGGSTGWNEGRRNQVDEVRPVTGREAGPRAIHVLCGQGFGISWVRWDATGERWALVLMTWLRF